MSYHITDGEAFHALHLNRVSKRHDGWGVYDLGAGNCNVVINTGNLGTGTGTLTVQPGDALLNGTDAVIAEQVINIPQADTAPRKDAVVLYPDGSAGREAGTPEPKTPTSRELKRSERPAPPDLSTVDCVPLAIINVPEGATAITANEIVDVRPPAFVGGSGGTTAASISGRYPETGTITADGTASSFSWTIESPATLSMALADAATADASTDFSVTADDAANTITVSYATAPTGELAWNWAANVSITEVETVMHGAASHDLSVADQADLDAHTTNTANPHTTTAEQARLAGNTLEGTLRSVLGADDYRVLVDGSGGTVTDPFTLRFEDRDWRLVAGGVGGIGTAVRVGHDSGDVTLGGGITANGSGHITGDLTVDGNIAGTVDQSDLETKADKDGGGTGTLANYAEIETKHLSVGGWNEVDVTELGADPTGVEDTRPIIANNLQDNIRFIFPEGTYRFSSQIAFDGLDVSRFSIVGKGDVTLQMDTGKATVPERWLFKIDGDYSNVTNPVDVVEFENITWRTNGENCLANCKSRVLTRIVDVDLVDQVTAATPTLRPSAVRRGGVVWVERLRATDGTQDSADQNLIHHGNEHVGTAYFVGCHVENFRNGLYLRSPHGTSHVIGGLVKNVYSSGLRLHGMGSSARGVTVVEDTAGKASMTGINHRADDLTGDERGVTIDSCRIEFSDPTSTGNPIQVSENAGRMNVKNCYFDFGGHGAKILRTGAMTSTVGSGEIVFDSCEFHGTLDRTLGGAMFEVNRPVTFRDCHIDLTSTGGYDAGLFVTHEKFAMDGTTMNLNVAPGINLRPGADDATFSDCHLDVSVAGDVIGTNGGLRPKWEGVIGGGILGGVNIGGLTGPDAGELARANGTTGTADALYIRKASGVWQALHDPAVTITPA